MKPTALDTCFQEFTICSTGGMFVSGDVIGVSFLSVLPVSAPCFRKIDCADDHTGHWQHCSFPHHLLELIAIFLFQARIRPVRPLQ